MAKLKRSIAIRNLTGGLSLELTDYFASRAIHLLEETSVEDPTHILVDESVLINEVSLAYDIIEKNIKLISLAIPENSSEFLMANGDLVLDKSWVKNEIGTFILDKYFQEHSGIDLGEKYPNFQQQGSFIVSNPFGTGDYLDRMVFHAFSSEHGAMAIRTFFDHLMMFLASQRDLGKIGLPFEVNYGASQEVFGIQINFTAQNLELDEFIKKVKSHPSKKNDEFLLNHAIQSTGFFDLTFLKSIEKVVITALWAKGDRIDYENKGFLFSTLTSNHAVADLPSSGVKSFIAEEPELIDFIERKSGNIRKGTSEAVTVTVIAGSPVEEQVSQTIKGTKEEKNVSRVIKGAAKEDEKPVFKISSAVKEDDQFMSVKSLATNDINAENGKVKLVKESKNILAERLQSKNLIENTELTELTYEENKDKENFLLRSLRAEEFRTKKLTIELDQKESLLSQEVEKLQKQIKNKEFLLDKTKEVYTQMIVRKDQKLERLALELDQWKQSNTGAGALAQQNQIKDLEKQNSTLSKIVDMYKNKISSMSNGMQKSSEKSEDEHLKEDSRKLNLINIQLKNQLEASKKELARYQERGSLENSTLLAFKKEKAVLEQLLRKATLHYSKDSVPAGGESNFQENELKKLQGQVHFGEAQNKEHILKIKDMEQRLAEAQKLVKSQTAIEEPNRKTGQLEASIKKLTQDLSDSRNQLAESKKETNKLRQEKIGLQNAIDKMKKEVEKDKNASPKKPSGGKAA